MWFNVLEHSLSSFTRTPRKFLGHNKNLVKHTSSMRNDSDANCLNQQQERLTLFLKSLHHCLKCWFRTSLCQKHLAKTILSKLVSTHFSVIDFSWSFRAKIWLICQNWFLHYMNWCISALTKLFLSKKKVFEKSKGQFFMKWLSWVYNDLLIGPDWLVKTCSE